MSDRYSIRSNGTAGCYVATKDSSDSGVSLTPSLVSHGFGQVSVDFSLNNAMPTMLSSLSEPHWIFSYHDRFLRHEILSIGITPTGAVIVACPGGQFEMFSAGTVAPNGERHSALLSWSWLSGDLSLLLDGVFRTQATATFDPAVPSTLGVFSVLNGGNCASRFNVAVYSASAMYGYIDDVPSGKQTATWVFTEGAGDSVACVLSGDENGLGIFDLTLTRRWMYDYPCPWPTDFSGDPGEGAAWQLKTPFRRRTRAATRYRKRRVSWLS